MYRPARPFRSNLLALVLFSLVLATAACYDSPTGSDYCNENPQNCTTGE